MRRRGANKKPALTEGAPSELFSGEKNANHIQDSIGRSCQNLERRCSGLRHRRYGTARPKPTRAVNVSFYGSFAKRTMSATSAMSTSAKTKYPFFLSHSINVYASGIIVAHARSARRAITRTKHSVIEIAALTGIEAGSKIASSR